MRRRHAYEPSGAVIRRIERMMAMRGLRRLGARLGLGLLLAGLLMLLACRGGGKAPPEMPPPDARPSEVAEAFLRLWQEGRYEAMYDLLSTEARTAIDRQAFSDRYRAIAEEATITEVRARLLGGSREESGRQLYPFAVTFNTSFFGDISQESALPLLRESVVQEEPSPEATPRTKMVWRVAWSPSLIFKELEGNNLIHRFIDAPKRGTIFDRQGRPLVRDAPLPTVGVVPERVANPEATARRLSSLLSIPLEEVRRKLATDQPLYYFVPLKTLPPDTPQELIDQFYAMPEAVIRHDTKRVYTEGSLAAHLLGYLVEVSPEQLEELAPRGYQPGDKIGAAGVEAFFEKELAGERGGTLAVITPQGEVQQVLARRKPEPAHDVYLTIDLDVQRWAHEALRRQGSVVVMDPRDNSILALASYPAFDPNAFTVGLSPEAWRQLSENRSLPLLNRATMATYPPGSTFKVVTTAASLERGGFTASSRLPCPPVWTGMGPQWAKRNWQGVDRGPLTLAQGLMASCNPVFYEAALRLDDVDPGILPSFAKGFGLGRATGVVGLAEDSGFVPDPKWKEATQGEPWYSGDSVNMGIGQGFLMVTPIQVANMYTAIATGTLRTPLLVRRIVASDGTVVQEFKAEDRGRLPVSEGTLAVIRDGLWKVINDPGGTSFNAFRGSPVVFAGKSGTAEDLAVGQDHVLFVAYAPFSEPRALATVVLDEGRFGSSEAGPIVRSVIESLLTTGARAAAALGSPQGGP